jgi:hypothetical protein
MSSIGIEDQVVVLTQWGCKWISYAFDKLVNGSQIDQCAVKLMDKLETTNENPEEYVEEHIVTLKKEVKDHTGLVSTPVNNVKKSHKLKKGCRSKFAMALAKEAYLKFGRRPINEANEIVTRKWMVKYLEKFSDLRTADKILAVDRALFLSFVPTIVYNNMHVVANSSPVSKMVSGVTTSFGKVFSVRGTLSK